MNGIRLLRNEMKLLLKSKLTYIFLLLPVGFAVLGLNALDYSNAISLHRLRKTSLTMALGSAQYGALAGCILFAMLTLLTLSKDRRKNSKEIIQASTIYDGIWFARIFSLLVYVIMTVLLAILSTYMIQIFVMGVPYNFGINLFSYGTVMLPAMFYTVMICSGLYMMSENLDIGFVVFAGLFFMGLSSSDYRLNWIKTHAMVYSDFGGVQPVAGLMLYNRLLWSFISLSVILLGILLRKRYELNLYQSLVLNVKSVYIPALLAILLVSSGFTYAGEPFVNPNDSVFDSGINADNRVKLTRLLPKVTLYTGKSSMTAEVVYEFKKEKDVKWIDFIINTGLKINKLTVDGVSTALGVLDQEDIIRVPVPKGERVNIKISYSGTIRYPGANAVAGYISDQSVYLLENSHWIFEPLTDCDGVVDIQGSITVPKSLTVVTVGKIEEVSENDGMKTWKYGMKAPGFDVGMFAAEYRVVRWKVGKTDVEFYYSPEHEAYIRMMQMKKYISDIVQYYTATLGSYAFDDVPLKVVETPMYKTGGHSTMNVVTVAEYLFNRQSVKGDAKADFTFFHDIQVIAHEIGHQWWGTGVNFQHDPPWSSEGLTEYIAYKYMTTAFHPSLTKSIVHGWELAVRRHSNKYFANGEQRKRFHQRLLRKIEGETRFVQLYNEMPLRLLKLEEMKGEVWFLRQLSSVYRQYLYQSLSYGEFLKFFNIDKEAVESE